MAARAPSLSKLVAGCVWLLAGCSLVVSGDPVVVCQSDDGCPSGQRCVVATGTCLAAADTCTSDSCSTNETCDPVTLRCVADDVVPPTPDASDAADTGASDGTAPEAEAGPPAVQIGSACRAQGDCSLITDEKQRVPGVCAFEALSGFDVPSFCTKNCCKNDDCPQDFFCDHGPNAGRYCVPFGERTRARPTGSKRGGENCAASTECASGSCDYALPQDPDQKTCIDTCCRDADCATGLVCGLRDGDTLQWVCRLPFGPGAANSDCSSVLGPAACRTGACYGGADAFCTASCCSNASCIQLGLSRCVSGSTEAGTSVVNICAEPSDAGNADATCSSDGDCKSGICVATRCASTCCTDGDCPTQQKCVADGNEPRPHCAAN